MSQIVSGKRKAESGKLLSWPLATRPSGLTLVEMLVAMAITLIMMAAVVNLFANVGASVRNRRATIEMSGQLRMVRLRLHNDLVGATCPTLTWQRPGDDNGYLEIVEGQWSDKNPSILMDGVDDGPGTGFRNRELDYATSLVPSGGDPLIKVPSISARVVASDDVTNGGGLGDYDDILALTVRSEGEPFVGRAMEWKDPDGSGPEPLQWVPTTIESTLAEVIWYAVQNPADGSLGEPGMRTVYRRVLLIAPWVTLPSLNNVPGVTSSMTIDEKILAYYRNFDISAQIYSVDSTPGNVGNLIPNTTSNLVPNTLGDLTKRENRFAHRANADATARGWPYIIDQRAMQQTSYDPTAPPPSTMGPLRPFGSPFEPTGAMPERQGEDVVLSDVLAFDVRVYDPGALIMQEPATGVILEPCDVGWNPTLGTLAGYGAYVDLGWYPGYPLGGLAGAPTAWYPYPRQAGWHPRTGALTGYPAVYDTWSFHYENDGIDQEVIDNPDLLTDNGAGVDQGTNGLDDNIGSGFINGVDDMGERETAPPYDVPLRGLQVKLRVYEPDTRNIRETTVTRNFVP